MMIFGPIRDGGGVKGTVDNLQAAINGEGYEFQKMYPEFLKEAEAEKNAAAAVSFRYALAVEKIHYDLYSQALESLKKGKDLPGQDIFVCEICGNTVYGHAQDKCSVCGIEDHITPKPLVLLLQLLTGILVTTSHYGSDAYEFAQNKPLKLFNGAQLLG